jgi:MoxR-like ATPase
MIQELAIDSDRLNTIKSLVPELHINHQRDLYQQEPLSIDSLREKETGHVVLLIGPPGTGKTFTVQCIAEYTGMLHPDDVSSPLTQFI